MKAFYGFSSTYNYQSSIIRKQGSSHDDPCVVLRGDATASDVRLSSLTIVI